MSLAVLLATFMGGMCIGSLLLLRVPQRFRPLRVYAAVELGIGLWGLAVLRLVPLAGRVYTEWAGYGLAGFLLRGAVAAVCLLPPTLLMGATLPALARAVDAAGTRDDTPWLGGLYSANIAGAVGGCLLAGFYLLCEFDTSTATYFAMGVNVAIAGAALLASHAAQTSAAAESSAAAHTSAAARPAESHAPSSSGRVYIAIALSGMCALAAEAVWTRLLGLLLGASVYALAIVLAVFLTGLGIGSGIGSGLARNADRARTALGWCQVLAAVAVAWGAYNLDAALPHWPTDPSLSPSIRFTFQLDLAQAMWAILPAALLWGASFPLALAAAGADRDAGRRMARVYAANTLGAIAGALAASLLLIAWIGSQHAEQVLIGISLVAGLVLLIPAGRAARTVLAAAAAVGLAGVLIYAVPPVAKLLIAYGRYAATWVGRGEVIYAAEGVDSSVAVASFANGSRTFHVAGKVQASNVARDMRLQRMLGHLTTLTVAHPRSVLVIGCGAGITAGAVSVDPRVEHETIAEIEPLVPRTAAAYFGDANFGVLHNPKVQVKIDDGRHYLLTAKERFDGITVDPLDPWVKGAANLYTLEFVESMKQHLNPGGAVTMYIQLFETDLAAVKSAVSTFFQVFPNATVWGNPYQGQGHDMVLLGTVEPLRVDLDRMEQLLRQPEFSGVERSLEGVSMSGPVDLFSTYAGRARDLKEWLRGAAVNRDRNLRMEYLAGLGLDRDDGASIYAGMLKYRRYPADIFHSTEGRDESIELALGRTDR